MYKSVYSIAVGPRWMMWTSLITGICIFRCLVSGSINWPLSVNIVVVMLLIFIFGRCANLIGLTVYLPVNFVNLVICCNASNERAPRLSEFGAWSPRALNKHPSVNRLTSSVNKCNAPTPLPSPLPSGVEVIVADPQWRDSWKTFTGQLWHIVLFQHIGHTFTY